MLRYDRCQNVRPGAHWTTLTHLAAIRGASLIPAEPGEAADLASPDPLFVLFNGPVPGPGYEFALVGGQQHETGLTLEFEWRTPEALPDGPPRAPCVAYALPASQPARTVRIMLDDALFAELNVPQR